MENKETGQESSSLDLTQVFCMEKEIEDLGQNIVANKEKLENLKKEVAQAEQSLRKTEDRVKDKEEMLQELHNQKTSLEEQREKLSKDINEISATLQEKNDRLNKMEKELAVAEREKKLVSKKRRLASKAVLVSLIVVILCGWIYFSNEISSWESLYENAEAEKCETQSLYENAEAERSKAQSLYENAEAKRSKAQSLYENAEAERSKAQSLYENAEAEKNKAQSLYEDTKAEKEKALEKISRMKAYAGPAIIKVNKVYNADKNQVRISDELKETKMRYLTFDFDILFLEDNVKNVTVYVDIYSPYGSLKEGSSSPEGHSFSCEVDGTGNAFESSHGTNGWGSSTESRYSAGTYRVDFIYKDVIIHSQKVIITK